MKDIILALFAIALFAAATVAMLKPVYSATDSINDKIAADAKRSKATARELRTWSDKL